MTFEEHDCKDFVRALNLQPGNHISTQAIDEQFHFIACVTSFLQQLCISARWNYVSVYCITSTVGTNLTLYESLHARGRNEVPGPIFTTSA